MYAILLCSTAQCIFFYFISFLITLLEPYFILLFCIFSQSLVLFVLALFYLKQSFQKKYFDTELRGWGMFNTTLRRNQEEWQI